VFPAERMELVAVSGVYMRLAADCLVHTRIHCSRLYHFVSIHVAFDRVVCPLVTLLVPCVCSPERQSLRPTVPDDNLFFMETCDVSILVNKTVHRSNYLLFSICFMDAAKLAKTSFQQFKISNLFCSKHNRQAMALIAAF
jgi:hypothetical protein